MPSARNSALALCALLLSPTAALPQTSASGADSGGRVETNVEKLRQAEEHVLCLERHLLDIEKDVFGAVWIFELRNTCKEDRIVTYHCATRPDLRREETIWAGGSAVVECREEFEENADLRITHRPAAKY